VADYFGWDIGGVHLKSARLTATRGPVSIETRMVPYEIWKEPAALAKRIRALLADRAGAHAVTMTAELSDAWSTRAEGVRAILGACREALPGPLRVLDLRGRLVPLDAARERPLDVAAANWLATATLIGRAVRDALLVDVGSTTTDIVAIRDGIPCPAGRTDTERLVSGELVYTGCLRTPPASLAEIVPLGGGWCRVSPEHFTNMGDVHTILGAIEERDYTVATPDGRGRSREDAKARLARLVCADAGTIGDHALETIARFLAERQVGRIAQAIVQVLSRHPGGRPVAVPAGAGVFLAESAARRAGLGTVALAGLFPRLAGDDWGRAAPAAALSVLLAEEIEGSRFIT
jgi:(4-(4-[2-(gamma-L-glutamylamino)ethyl]phenoxymethyl)furan-2-yl)methanamine synthase